VNLEREKFVRGYKELIMLNVRITLNKILTKKEMKKQDDKFVDSGGIFEWKEKPEIGKKNNETDWAKKKKSRRQY
jgi:hypothetical protein